MRDATRESRSVLELMQERGRQARWSLVCETESPLIVPRACGELSVVHYVKCYGAGVGSPARSG